MTKNKLVGKEAKSSKSAIKDLYKTSKAAGAIVMNERAASKSALKDVKEIIDKSVSKKDRKEALKVARRNTKNWEYGYREGMKSRIKTRAANLVNIPSRRVGI